MRLVDAISLDDLQLKPFHFSRDAITHIAFSHDCRYLATAVSVVLLRRVLDSCCWLDSSQCLAQLTPTKVGIARSVHVQLEASSQLCYSNHATVLLLLAHVRVSVFIRILHLRLFTSSGVAGVVMNILPLCSV